MTLTVRRRSPSGGECAVCSLSCVLQAQKEAELAEAPGTITMDDLPPAPAGGAANGAANGGGSTASRDVTPPSAGMTVPYADLKG